MSYTRFDEYFLIPDSGNIREALDKYGVYYEEIDSSLCTDNEDFLEFPYLKIFVDENEIIGEGANGFVVDLNSKLNDTYKVFKVTKNEREIKFYETLYQLWKTDKSITKYFVIPEIYYIYTDNYEKIYYCFMDYLNQLDGDEFNLLSEIDINSWNLESDVQIKAWDYMWEDIFNGGGDNFNMSGIEIHHDKLVKIKQWCEEVIPILVENNFLDAHIGNILMDDNGNLKLVDLLASI